MGPVPEAPRRELGAVEIGASGRHLHAVHDHVDSRTPDGIIGLARPAREDAVADPLDASDHRVL